MQFVSRCLNSCVAAVLSRPCACAKLAFPRVTHTSFFGMAWDSRCLYHTRSVIPWRPAMVSRLSWPSSTPGAFDMPIILNSKLKTQNSKLKTQNSKLKPPSRRSIQFGKSKLFFRVGVLAKIEDERRAFQQKNAARLQAVVRGHASRGRAAYRRAYIRILAACRVVQAQRLYCRTLAAMHAQAVSKRAVCRSRHGSRLLAGRSLASVAATYVKRLAFVIGCVRSRASVCTSSAGRRAVARHALVMQRVSAVTAQAVMRQCLCRSLHIRVCAADTLKRYCVTKRLMAAKRETLLKNAAVIKILFARRRAQFYRRWYNRLVGRSVRVMQCVPQTLPSPLQPPICPNVFL